MRVGQARKRDANEAQIVHALEQVGAQVIRLSDPGAPDLLTCYRGRVQLLEVKTAAGTRTPAQLLTQALGWPVVVVRTVAEALQAVGVQLR